MSKKVVFSIYKMCKAHEINGKMSKKKYSVLREKMTLQDKNIESMNQGFIGSGIFYLKDEEATAKWLGKESAK